MQSIQSGTSSATRSIAGVLFEGKNCLNNIVNNQVSYNIKIFIGVKPETELLFILTHFGIKIIKK